MLNRINVVSKLILNINLFITHNSSELHRYNIILVEFLDFQFFNVSSKLFGDIN